MQKDDFKIIATLGKGSYGNVNLVEKDGKKYALKELSKDFIVKVLTYQFWFLYIVWQDRKRV